MANLVNTIGGVNLSTPFRAGPIRIELPLMDQGDTAYKVLYEPLAVKTNVYSCPAIGGYSTAGNYIYDNFGDSFFFCGDYNFKEQGDTTFFDRMWSNTPANTTDDNIGPTAGYFVTYDYVTSNFTYPGFAVGTVTAGRTPFTKTVMTQVERAYFNVGVDSGINKPDQIPLIKQTEMGYTGSFGRDVVDVASIYLNNGGGAVVQTFPSINEYKALMANTGSYSIVSEASSVSRFRGNLYERVTKRVKAY